MKAIFDVDVFQSSEIARSWVSDKDEASLLDAKNRMSALMKDTENPQPHTGDSDSSFSHNSSNSIHEDAKEEPKFVPKNTEDASGPLIMKRRMTLTAT